MQYPANNPIEDRILIDDDENIKIFCVFDGHGGY